MLYRRCLNCPLDIVLQLTLKVDVIEGMWSPLLNTLVPLHRQGRRLHTSSCPPYHPQTENFVQLFFLLLLLISKFTSQKRRRKG